MAVLAPPPDWKWDAAAVRALRQHLKYSQEAMAGVLGMRQQTISEWETGLYKPRGASVTVLTLMAQSSGFDWRTDDDPEFVRVDP